MGKLLLGTLEGKLTYQHKIRYGVIASCMRRVAYKVSTTVIYPSALERIITWFIGEEQFP